MSLLKTRPRLVNKDRILWVVLSRIWHGWRDALVVVKRDTVVRWQSIQTGRLNSYQLANRPLNIPSTPRRHFENRHLQEDQPGRPLPRLNLLEQCAFRSASRPAHLRDLKKNEKGDRKGFLSPLNVRFSDCTTCQLCKLFLHFTSQQANAYSLTP